MKFFTNARYTPAFPRSFGIQVLLYIYIYAIDTNACIGISSSFILSCELIIQLTKIRLNKITAKYIYKNGNSVLELRSNLMIVDMATF